MNRHFNRCFMLVSIILPISLANAQESSTGWLWYKDPLPIHPVKPTDKSTDKPVLQPQKQLTARQIMQAQKDAWDESLATSVLHPSLENAKRTQQFQRFILAQATKFQEAWMAAEALNPSLEGDHNLKSRQIKREEEQRLLDSKLRYIAQEYGLFFVFSSNCQYCHAFAPIVEQFTKNYGYEIAAISADGKGIAGFPNPLPNNGIIQKINPKGVYPALFLVSRKTQQIIPLAQSFLTMDELLENAKYILRYMENLK